MSHRVTRTLVASTIALASIGLAPMLANANIPTVPTPVQEDQSTAGHEVITDDLTSSNSRFVVTMNPVGTKSELQKSLAANATKAAKTWQAHARVTRLQDETYVVVLDDSLTRAEATKLMEDIAKDPDVASVRADRRIKITRPSRKVTHKEQVAPQAVGATNDTLSKLQWDMFDPEGGINLSEARQMSTGEGIVVAVIDTGIVDHPDLNANRLPGYDFVSMDEGIDFGRDGDSYDADPTDEGDWHIKNQGICVDPLNPDPNDRSYDSSFHGTHVAGTIAAVANNNEGITGVASDVKFFAARVLGECGGWDTDIAAAIRWSAGATDVRDPYTGKLVPPNQNKAHVINMSLGGDGEECTYQYSTAINYARMQGVTVVVAAGNEGENTIHKVPANCGGAITVGATGPGADSTWYSNFGREVSISAPGGDQYGFGEFTLWRIGQPTSSIISTVNSSPTSPDRGQATYDIMDGTSMATPHVTGIVALMKAVNPDLTPDRIRDILEQTARRWSRNDSRASADHSNLPAGMADNCLTGACGVGIVDAAAAVRAAMPNAPEPRPSESATPTPTATATATPKPTPSATATPTPTPTATTTKPPATGDTEAPSLVVYPQSVTVKAGAKLSGIRILAQDNKAGVTFDIKGTLPQGIAYEADKYTYRNSDSGYIKGSTTKVGTYTVKVQAKDAAGNLSETVTITIRVI